MRLLHQRVVHRREDSVTEQLVPAPTSAHADESPAQLRDSPLTTLASLKHRHGQEQAFPPPAPGSNWEASPDAVVKLCFNTG